VTAHATIRGRRCVNENCLWFVLLGTFLLPCMVTPSHAQLEPDKKVASVGKWEISTARFGVGCVAQLDYNDGYFLNIGGQAFSSLQLLITVDPKAFSTVLNSDEPIPDVEIALVDRRWGDLKPWGYRGTSGVVLTVDRRLLSSFIASKAIKVTERGYEKIAIRLEAWVTEGHPASFGGRKRLPSAC
jgi:hypothetical protein